MKIPKIHIVDAGCGSGKTSAAINLMNRTSNLETNFIYITPFLTEVKRIIKSCPDKKFKEPEASHTKKMGLNQLLNKGRNIVTTHSLFQQFDNDIIERIQSFGYTLIMDEVTEVIKPHEITKDDADLLLSEFAYPDPETRLIKWKEEKMDYDGEKFAVEKQLCEWNALGMYGDTIMMWLFPIEIFTAFKEIYILTYLFEGQLQKYYYDFHNVKYDYLSVIGNDLPSYEFSDSSSGNNLSPSSIKPLINIIDDEKMNRVGTGEYTFTASWFYKNKSSEIMNIIKNNLTNMAKHKKVSYNESTGEYKVCQSNDIIWTTYKDYKDKLKGKGYTKGFIPCNARATNDYKDRNVIFYCVNIYMNPVIKNFFVAHNIEVNEDLFALSMMIQFVWRSAIRDGHHITIYVPSSRMRELFMKWLDEDL